MKKNCFTLRLAALLLCLALLASSCAPAVQEPEPAPAPESSAPVPSEDPPAQESAAEPEGYALGDQLHGFTLTEERELVSPPALLHVWKHDKTGAQAYFIHNDDPNRTFSIAFRTEPSDDTGKLHILEHAVCAASEKYPGQDVFFDVISQAYITEMNATTFKSATNYYVGSMSEDQLERVADFYLDCSFNSALREEPNYFYREGWRYSMEDADAPLTVDGIVYNEMKGVYGNIYNKHYQHGVDRALFPDTYQKWDSGGDPDVIPELSYEELIAFYNECYHPSNSVSMFYGDLETARYLKLMDEEYFSKFEAQPSAGYSPGQTSFAEMVVYEQDFPVSADSDQTGSVISYAVALPEGLDYTEIVAMNMGTACLGDDSSPLMEALYATGIGANYWLELMSTGSQFVLMVSTDEADPSRAEEFKDVVLETLSAMVEEGFDGELLDSIYAGKALENALVSNDSGIGVTIASRIATAIDSGYFEMLDEAACYQAAQELSQNGGLERLFREYFLQNTHTALVTTTPEPGLQEQQEQELAARMAEKKAAMSEEEIARIVADTAAFTKWNDETGTIPETLDKLRTETPQSVSAQLPVYETQVTQLDGATLYTADVEGDAVYCQYLFDLSHLSTEEIRALDVYVGLMGGATEGRDQREISIAARSLLSVFDGGVEIEPRAGGGVYPALSLGFYAMDDKVEEAAALVMEMFSGTDLEDNAYRFESVLAGNMQRYFNGETVAEHIAPLAANADSSDASALKYALLGMDKYDYLARLSEMDDAGLAGIFASAREKALVREGATVICVGDAKGRQTRGNTLCALLPEPGEALTPGDWTTLLEGERADAMAFKSGGAASYAAAAVDIDSLGMQTTGELQLLTNIIRNAFLLPEMRFQMGAYSTSMNLDQLGNFSFSLYRAPSFAEALARLPELPDEMEVYLAGMTEKELSDYQLARLSSMVLPSGPWNEAANQIRYLRRGVEPAQRQAVIDQVRDATPESLAAALPQLREIIDALGYAVVAPGSAIDAEAELFDKVVSLP